MAKYNYSPEIANKYVSILQEAIAKHKYSLKELGMRTGLTYYDISKTLKGKIEPSILYKLDVVLGTDILKF